jgi:hypothetical protein
VYVTKNPGNHVAQLKESYNIKGLLPAPLICTKKLLLCGYSKMLSPFIYLLYDYNNSNFFSGNKRKIKIAPVSSSGGYRYQDGLHYYLTNENFVRKPIFNSPQQLHSVDLSVLANYLIK